VSWSISIPYRDCGQRLDDPDVLALPRALEDREERAVAERVLLGAMETPGLETIGDLLDLYESLDAAERRQVLEGARRRAGLPSTAAIEWEHQQEQLDLRGAIERDESGCAFQACAEEGCSAEPINPRTGAPAKVAAKRWWCEAHRAGHEDDMRPFVYGLRYARSGAILTDDEVARRAAEAQKMEVENESRRRRREAQQAERAEEAERRAAWERERDAALRREMPRGLRP
jgi:hypothetical protein